jgi:hypothetical protein
LSGDLETERKKSRAAKFPYAEEALLTRLYNGRDQNVSIDFKTIKEMRRYLCKSLVYLNPNSLLHPDGWTVSNCDIEVLKKMRLGEFV